MMFDLFQRVQARLQRGVLDGERVPVPGRAGVRDGVRDGVRRGTCADLRCKFNIVTLSAFGNRLKSDTGQVNMTVAW